jgi:hypothetical protein
VSSGSRFSGPTGSGNPELFIHLEKLFQFVHTFDNALVALFDISLMARGEELLSQKFQGGNSKSNF